MKSLAKGVLIGIVLSATFSAVAAEEQSGEKPEKQAGLVVPDDLTFDNRGFLVFEEQRVGGRLERVTVQRDGAPLEIYKNNRDDVLWNAAEAELGEGQNQRQWRIGSW